MNKRSLFVVLLGALTSIGLGCYDPKFKDCEKLCGPSTSCPSGMTCESGRCTSGQKCGTDAGADGDAKDVGDTGIDRPGDSTDVPTDVAIETPPDVPTDVAIETPPDVPTDVEIDTPPDAPPDMEIDTPPDVPPDMEIDTPPDVPPSIDTAPDVPTDGDGPAPWSPGVIPNLVLWLEGDRGIDATPGGKISEWRDQSPLHNDARQTMEMFAPKLAAGPFGGMPGVEFSTKAWLTIADDLSLRWGVFDFLVLVVFRATSRCENECILQQLYRKQDPDWPWRGPGVGLQPNGMIEVHLDHEAPNQWLNSPAAGYDSGRIHLAGGQRYLGWPRVRVDGIDYPALRPSSVTNLDAPGENVYIGAHGLNPDPPLDFPFRGYIGAVVAVQGPISPADLAQLERYLIDKYGVKPGGPP